MKKYMIEFEWSMPNEKEWNRERIVFSEDNLKQAKKAGYNMIAVNYPDQDIKECTLYEIVAKETIQF